MRLKPWSVDGTMNEGHGHVYRRPDGQLARCGGPAICKECSRDLQKLKAHHVQNEPKPASSRDTNDSWGEWG